jgi:hypothetical protein
MVAKQRHGASLDLAHHGVDDVARIGAISDVIAEKDKAADPGTPGMIEGRLERFPVRMNVAEQSNPHKLQRLAKAEIRQRFFKFNRR